MSKAIKLAFITFSFGFLLFSFTETASAQSCVGTTPKCGTTEQEVCRDGSGNVCIDGTFGCVCNYECGGTTWTCNSCSGAPGAGGCAAAYACLGIDSCICVIPGSGSCGWSVPPPPTSPPATPNPGGGGSCGWCTSSVECTNVGGSWGGANPGACDPDTFGCCTLPGGGGGGSGPNPNCASVVFRRTLNGPNITSLDMGPGETANIRMIVTYTDGQITSFNVSASNPFTARPNATNYGVQNGYGGAWYLHDVRPPLPAVISGGSAIPGSTSTLVARANTNNGGSCSGSLLVRINQPATAWWQSRGGNVVSGGFLTSNIPATCSALVNCDPRLILANTGVNPALAMYENTLTTGSGTVSSTNQRANTSYSGKMYNSSYVKSIMPTDIVWNNIAGSINNGTISSGNSSKGYYWYRATSPLTLSGNLNISGGRKVVILADDTVTIQGRVSVANPETDFFLLLSSGDIIIDPSVTNAGSNPALQGLFLADGQIRTGASANRLTLQGSAVAWGGFSLQRDLGPANSNTPSELFIYDPRLLVNYPRYLIKESVIWREVAP